MQLEGPLNFILARRHVGICTEAFDIHRDTQGLGEVHANLQPTCHEED